jgi:hypothetical protein
VDSYRAGIYDTYLGWLERHAINPQTGAMSAKGRAFFESCVGQNCDVAKEGGGNARIRALLRALPFRIFIPL